MYKKSKLISGLTVQKIVRRPNKYFTIEDKHLIIQEMIKTGCTKRDIWEKYTGQKEEHGQLLRWMRQLGYEDSISTKKGNFAANSITQMKKKSKQQKKLRLCLKTFN